MQGNVTLASLANGALEELFQEELTRTVDNILDPNTIPDAKRTISLRIEIEPSEKREMATVRVFTGTKLAAIRGAETVLYMGRVKGENVVAEQNPAQLKMFEQPEPARFPPRVGGLGGDE
jgi:hypothetical protein